MARWLYRRGGRFPLLNPVFITILLLVSILTLTHTSYKAFFDGAQFIHFLLGPATVALAIPLFRQMNILKKHPLAIVAAVLTGSVATVVSAVFIAKLAGASTQSIISLIPKSVTTPVAMGISEQLGGLPSLTAVLVILTGILGASIGPWLLQRLRITSPIAQGLAMGTSSHGIGTGRAVYMSDVAAAFSGLAMGLNALISAVLIPVFYALFT